MNVAIELYVGFGNSSNFFFYPFGLYYGRGVHRFWKLWRIFNLLYTLTSGEQIIRRCSEINIRKARCSLLEKMQLFKT